MTTKKVISSVLCAIPAVIIFSLITFITIRSGIVSLSFPVNHPVAYIAVAVILATADSVVKEYKAARKKACAC